MAATSTTHMLLIAKRPFPTNNFPLRRNIVFNCVSSSSITTGLDDWKNGSLQLTKNIDDHQSVTARRSGNYSPPHWGFDYIQSLDTEYSEERHLTRASELKMEVKKMLEISAQSSTKPVVDQLKLIDDLQRLGISHHFEDEINIILTNIYEQKYIHYHRHVNTTIATNNSSIIDETMENDLYSTALEFRLLRKHGFSVPQEIFDCFKDEKGNFESRFEKDTKGLLELYEASHLLFEGENTLELGREFSSIHLHELKRNMNRYDDDDENLMSMLVRNALEMPFHWRVQRPNVRWFIDAYGKRKDKNSAVVLELAKLDFNIVQAKHQQELKQASSWWKETCLAEKLPFARDRLVENYFWTIGFYFHPQYDYSRIMVTKVNAFIAVVDDIYDVYGTLDELERFTDVIQS